MSLCHQYRKWRNNVGTTSGTIDCDEEVEDRNATQHASQHVNRLRRYSQKWISSTESTRFRHQIGSVAVSRVSKHLVAKC